MKNESGAWRVLRDNIVRASQELGGAAHIVRIENMVEAGVFDANICFKGHDFWLEGKHLDYLPVRESTLIKVGFSEEQRVFAIRRLLAGGYGYLWLKVAMDRRKGDAAWYLFPLRTLDIIDKLRSGIKYNEFLWHRYATAKELSLDLLQGVKFSGE